ncbi:MAG: tetratricopeptide repeat protein [Acidobacteriota bacterium]
MAPELASLVAKFSREPEPLGSLWVRALAVLASGYRATGELDQAEATYSEAMQVARREGIPDAEWANLLFRVAVLRSAQNRLDESRHLAGKAVAIYRKATAEVRQRHLGEALTIRGYSHAMGGDWAPAMKDWSEALCCTDPKKRPRVYYCASLNLACGLVAKTIDSRSLSAIERCLRQARKFLSKRPRSTHKLRLIWLEGMIMIRFGSTRRGQAALEAARRGFIAIGAPFDLALVSLVLGRYLRQSHQVNELKALAVETQHQVRLICSDKQTNEALMIWKEAVLTRARASESFNAAWQVVQQRGFASRSIPGAG